MLTLEQIKNVTFTKTRGGYRDVEVDDFIDQCVDTVSGLMEERNASNKKLEVLADKLVEYRNEEDSIRSALVNAQRLGDTIVREANQKAELTQKDATIKAEKIVADAENQAKQVLAAVVDEVKAEEAELARLKREVSLFKERMLSIYKDHLSLINVLPEEKPAPAPEEKAEPEEAQPTAEPEPVEEAPEEPEVALVEPDAVEEDVPVEEAAPVEEATVETVPLMVEEPEEAKPRSRFSDLRFGEDYVISEDHQQSEGHGFFRRKK